MYEFESDKGRASRLYRTLDSLIQRVRAGEHPGPLREHLRIAMMISPLSGDEQCAAFARFDEVVEALPKPEGNERRRNWRGGAGGSRA